MKKRNRAKRTCHSDPIAFALAFAGILVHLPPVMDSLPARFTGKRALSAIGIPPTELNQEAVKLVLSLLSDVRRDPHGAYRLVKGGVAC